MKRYDFTGVYGRGNVFSAKAIESPEGDYVKYSDVVKLEKEIHTLNEYLRIQKEVADETCDELEAEKAELIEYINNQANEYEDSSARKLLLKNKKYIMQYKE
jgi:hypothetical protein